MGFIRILLFRPLLESMVTDIYMCVGFIRILLFRPLLESMVTDIYMCVGFIRILPLDHYWNRWLLTFTFVIFLNKVFAFNTCCYFCPVGLDPVVRN